MRKKISKFAILFGLPIVAFLALAIFLVSGFVNIFAFAFSGNGCGLYVGSKATTIIGETTKISGNTATNGGGVYNSGNVIMNGGTISGNTATSGYGNNVYNTGTFTMNDGTIGSDRELEYQYVRVDEDGNEDRFGEYIVFGSWRKSVKSDDVTINEDDVDENGYYLGSDGERYYKGISFYYKIEPLKWRILKESNGEALLLCENVVAEVSGYGWYTSYTYGDKFVDPNDYESSNVRDFLLGTTNWNHDNCFLGRAFTDEEESIILTTEIDNSLSYRYNIYDKVFLLSVDEVMEPEYGFRPSLEADLKRQINNACWFLRTSITSSSDEVYYVNGNGEIRTVNADRGAYVVPALRISLTSTTVSSTNEGYGIENDNSMEIEGGTVYDDIYNTNSLHIDSGANVYSTIVLSQTGFVSYSQNEDEYPYFNIVVSDTHSVYSSTSTSGPNGAILVVNYTDSIDLSKFKIKYNDSKFNLIVTDENNQLIVRLESKKTVYFTSSWQTTFANYYDLTSIEEISFQKEFVPYNYQLLYSSGDINCYIDLSSTKFLFQSDYNIEIGGAEVFSNLTNVKYIFFNGVKVGTRTTNMSQMFYNCSNLKSVDLSDWNVRYVEKMTEMFSGCSSLSELDLSKWLPYSVKNMYRMFYGCSSLEKLFIGNFESRETDIITADMFLGCSKLLMLDLSGFENINQANFLSSLNMNNCLILKTPYNCRVDLSLSSGFYDIQDDDISEIETTENHSQFLVTDFLLTDYVTWFSESLTITGTLEEELVSAGYDYDVSELTNIRFEFLVPRGYHEVGTTTCGAVLWVSNKDPYDVALVSREQIKAQSCIGFFMGYKNLERIILTNFNTSGCENMRQMFQNCTSLSLINLGGFDTSSVTDMRAMFYGCSMLQKLYLTSFDVSSWSVSHSGARNTMFSGCSSIKVLDLSSFDLSSLSVSLSIPKLSSLQTFRTPFGNASAISLTAVGVTLYDTEGNTVTSIPANSTESMTLSKVKPTTTTTTVFVSDGGNITSRIVSNLKTREWRNNLSIGSIRKEKELFFEKKKKIKIVVENNENKE